MTGEDGASSGVPEQYCVVAGNISASREASPDESSTSGLKSLLQSVKVETERNVIATALEQTRWNRKAAARLLKISYRTLLYKIEQHHLNPPASCAS